MSNLRNIQLLRNSAVYANLKAAKDALLAKADDLLDGSPIIGRYTYTDASGATSVKTVIGIAHKNVSGENGVTFFESANDIADAIAKLQQEMDTTQAAVGLNEDGTHKASASKFTSAATTVEAEIAALAQVLDALDYEKTVGESEVFSKIEEVDGMVSAETKNLTAVKLEGLGAGSDAKILSTNTLGEALANIQAQIDAMDKDADVVAGQVVTTVTEADGKVTETKANVKDLQLGGYEKAAATGAIASADTVNVALSKIENAINANAISNADGSINVTPSANGTDINVNIKSGDHVLAKDGNGGVYTNIAISAVSGSELTDLGTNVKEAYKLVGTDNTKLGEYIKIYKDSSLKSVSLEDEGGKQYLVFVYIKTDGTEETVRLDVSTFLVESEFKSGVTATAAGVVTAVVDAASEEVITAYSATGNTTAKVLSVGADGFKVDNIQNAINAAVGKATTEVALQDDTQAGTGVAVDKHVTLSSATADNGKVTYTIHTNDIASKKDLDDEVTRAKAAEAEFDKVIGTTKASDSETRTYTKSGVHYINSGVTVKSDLEKLDASLYEASGKTLTNVTSDNNSISATITAHTDGTKTVNLTTDASKISGLTAVPSSDEGLAKISGVAATDSVQTAVKNLYDSIASEVAARKAAINGRTISSNNGGIVVAETPNADGFSTTLTLTLDGTTQGVGNEKTGTDNALTINTQGIFLSSTWECGTFDN